MEKIFPIDAYLPKIVSLVKGAPYLIIKAEPGAGKTTRVPLALLATLNQKIILVQPRRIAARLAAEWMAQSIGEKVGETVGYQIRFEAKSSPKTRLLVVTEGLLMRFLLQDPSLSQFGCVILDEFHERHIHSDLAVALVKKVMEVREDMRLVVMSATLDSSRLEKYLPQSSILEVPGKVYPVDVEYYPPEGFEKSWERHVARWVDLMSIDKRCPGNILVFLTGKKEIELVAEELRLMSHAREILFLTSESSESFFERFKRRTSSVTILATNVAETSVTLENVTGVVDGGKSKVAGFAPWSGMPTLTVQKVSRASSIQRAGRAGRTSQGVCYRLFSEHDFRSRQEFLTPEIFRIDLSQTILEVKILLDKLSLQEFDWFESPREAQQAQGLRLLKALGALGENQGVSSLGIKMAKWPLHPRLSCIILESAQLGFPEAGLLAALLLNESLFTLGQELPNETLTCDLLIQVLMLCHSRHVLEKIDRGKTQRIFKLYSQFQSLCHAKEPQKALEVPESLFRKVVYKAFADRVAKLRVVQNATQKNAQHLYHLCTGGDALLHRHSLALGAPYIVALDAEEIHVQGGNESSKTRILSAFPVEKSWLMEDPFSLLEKKEETVFDDRGQRPVVRNTIFYGDLLLDEESIKLAGDGQAGFELLLAKLSNTWETCFNQLEDLKIYHQKLKILTSLGIEHKMPLFEGDYLEILKHTIVEGCQTWDDVLKQNLVEHLSGLIEYSDLDLLKQMFPQTYELENGRKLKIHYSAKEDPYLEGRIQEFFGQKINPTICQGRWTLLLKLLAPNYRPTQITKDLCKFWETSYFLVRKELAARYPKHPWPEDPKHFSGRR